MNGAERVISLEHFPESYELGKINVSINKLQNKIELLPFALSERDDKIPIFIYLHHQAFYPLKEIEYLQHIFWVHTL
ncbi:hypothetical protein [Sulfuracidifex metallicus]|uniref:hypothetical protein n=1 Tax=Sulfuracidifex metallicus TaxID=47303 RepID=UPI003B848A48